MDDDDPGAADHDGLVAVIGMSGRFPGAPDLDTFWTNLRAGVESIRELTEDELVAAGEPLSLVRDPAYVRAAAPLDDIDRFDAAFFGMSPRDAAVFDPQHRLLLECAWEAFEHAGYVGERLDAAVGVFASCGASEYMFKHAVANSQVARSVGEWLIRHTGNDTNFLATRISYELDLTGPSMNVQTACSSTLVAVHLACQSLLAGECDLALAGGAVVAPQQVRGYVYKEGEILSPDGHCRAFDARSAGTVISSAAGAVLLKPLGAALDDGDNVLAVIRGSAINNDGRAKVGYLAPSVAGQARVVTEALAVAGVDARDVSYVETHGTGTLIGDPIEIAGLTQAYRRTTDDSGFCAIGSLKTNIGHTGEAAGVASLIKTVLALQHGELPPSLHYETPNPQIDFASTPFFVNAELRSWKPDDGQPRLAGVTGLGAGGTNAHVLVEEPPSLPPGDPSRPFQLLTLSARTTGALDRATADLAAHLRRHPDADIADVAFTRLLGRKAFRARRAVVVADADDAADVLDSLDGRRVATAQLRGDSASVVFMMPGGGAQYAGMGRGLYEAEPAYRRAIDDVSAVVNPGLGIDLRSVLFPDDGGEDADRRLERPSVALPALFATEYAMATLLASWGLRPDAMIGHSAGEYAVACLAGVLSMPDAARMVALRGRLFETLPAGGMLSVPLAEDELRADLPDGLSIAAVNAPGLCVVAGPVEALAAYERRQAERDVDTTRVHIDVAAHSAMLEPILGEFGAFCRTIRFSAPTVPYVSNLTGTWVTGDDVTDPSYWVRHLREPVRFGDGLAALLAEGERVLVEIGPGRTLCGLARQAAAPAAAVTPSMRHPKEEASDLAVALGAVGRAWTAGAEVDAAALWAGERRRRVPLPTYPFERQRYWIDPDRGAAPAVAATDLLRKQPDVADWFATPTWRRSLPPDPADRPGPVGWLLVADGDPLARDLADALRRRGDVVTEVALGPTFAERSDGRFAVDPTRLDDWTGLVDRLTAAGRLPDRIVHLTAVASPSRRRLRRDPGPLAAFDATVARDYTSLVFLARALSACSRPMRLAVVTAGVHALDADHDAVPARALLHGASRVIPRELGTTTTIAIDVELDDPAGGRATPLEALLRELDGEAADDTVAYRRGQRWTRRFESVRLPPATASPWRADGVYLVTGGLGGIGLAVAERMASEAPGVALVLVGRTPLPPEQEWARLLQDDATDRAVRRRIEAVRAMRAAGARVTVAAADVMSPTDMTAVVADARQRYGRITGVVHSAGILRDALIALRSPEPFSTVIDTKARGLLVLDQLLADEPPELVVLFSSVSSIIGLPGQVDYTAANAFLDAFATHRNRNGGTRTVVVNWSAWQEVGMAVDAVQAAQARDAGEPVAAPASPTQLLERSDEDGDDVVFATDVSRRRHWLVGEHVVRGGDALVPGTGHLEIVRSALAAAQPAARAMELRDVFFLSPFQVGAGEVRTLRVKLSRATGAVVAWSDAEASPHVTATAVAVEPDEPARVDLAAVRARCRRVQHVDGVMAQRFMDFGPRWANLRRVEYGAGEALVTTVLPDEFADEPATLWLHPAALDMATGGAQGLIPGATADDFFVPFSYGRVVVRGPMPVHAVSHVRLRPGADPGDGAPEIAVFDVAVCDPDGTEVITVEGFTMRRLSPAAVLTQPRPAGSQLAEPAGAESPIEAALREGILPAEGVDALDRILAVDLGAQVVASSIDIAQWAAKVDAEAAVDGGGDDGSAEAPQYERPEMSTPYDPPRTPIERELAAMWRELLGVERVGRDDDFFELGGQSLVAVRLFTRMRRRYDVDLALATLFEAPTVARCAAVVAQRAGIVDPPDDDGAEPGDTSLVAPTAASEPSTHPTEPDAFRSLVTIQRGGERTPFFCVHGAGGNVLNFRDLSTAMGRSQPFYGLQACGVDGVLRPHTAIEDMAGAYLVEVRTVQPHGPYLLGGYSGGGLVAFEMAHQLRDAGEEVALVVLLDTFPPTVPERRATMAARLGRLRDDGLGYLRHIVRHRVDDRRRATLAAQVAELLARDEVIPSELRNEHLDTNFTAAARRYRLRPWPGRVLLLRAHELAFAFRTLDETYGWSEVVDQLEVIEVPGDHNTVMLGPSAARLAEALGAAIERAATVTAGP